MKKSFILGGMAMTVFVISGCGKHDSQQASAPFEYEEAMEDMNSTLSNEVAAVLPDGTEAQVDPATAETMPAPITYDPSEPYVKPTHQEVQESLKNAGFYNGTVDGVAGPRTKKAIRDFQAQNNLNPDGRVGPQTWAKLAPYLHPASTTVIENTGVPAEVETAPSPAD